MPYITILQTPTPEIVRKARAVLEQCGIPYKLRYVRNRGNILARALIGGFETDDTRRLQYEIRVPKTQEKAAHDVLDTIQFEEE